MGITQQSAAARLIQPGVCTSSTRPASPFEGQAIFETDTDRMLIWNGTAWYPNWNTAWGQIGYAQRTTNITNIATTPTLVVSLTVTTVANRRYAITGNVGAYKEGGTNFAQGLIYKNGSQIARIGLDFMAAGGEATFCGTCFDSPSGGSTTYDLYILFSGNTLNEVRAGSTFPAYIQVSDIGPA